MTTGRHYGWRRQAHDRRDLHFRASRRMLAALPAAVDLSARLGPQLDQGRLGSCGPNSAAEMIGYDQNVQGLAPVPASRLFVYYCARSLMGTVPEDSGVDNRSMLKALAQYGFCPESLWPYSDDAVTFTRRPADDAFAAALPNRITSYAAVPQQLEQMQAALAAGHPWLLGFDVFPQMESDQAAQTGLVAMPKGGPVGGHDVTAVGYTLADLPGVMPGNHWPAGTIKFRNHWLSAGGSPWGDGGYGYLPFAYATSSRYAGDFWAIDAVPGVTPPSPPTPGLITLDPAGKTYSFPDGWKAAR